MFNNIPQPKNVKFLNHLKYKFFFISFCRPKNAYIWQESLKTCTGSPAQTDNYECYRWNFLNATVEFLE